MIKGQILKEIIVVGCLFLAFLANAQFGNEWVDPSKSYYKVKVGENGFYRINESQLRAAGFPTQSIPASRIQVFRRGKELAINVASSNTGTVKHIEFYAEKNDGTSDIELYRTGTQPHTYYNLFSDTAAYFITYHLNNQSGKRVGFSSNQNTSNLRAQNSHLNSLLKTFHNQYAEGVKFETGDQLKLSEYGLGETWTGGRIASSGEQKKDFTFQLDKRKKGNNLKLELVLVGLNKHRHKVAVLVGKDDKNLAEEGAIYFDGYISKKQVFTIPESRVSDDGKVVVRVQAKAFKERNHFVSVSSIKLTYNQEMTINSGENKVYYVSKPPSSNSWVQIKTASPSGVRIFDVNDLWNAKRLASTAFTGRVDAVIPNVVEKHKLLAVTSPKTSVEIEKVTLPDFSGDYNYLMISHPLLRKGSVDPVAEYQKYRQSSVGGSHKVLLADVFELYNLYNYGDPSPLAIKRFIQQKNNKGKVKNVLILGKGFTIRYDKFRKNNANTIVNIPSYGYPEGDLMYTIDYSNYPSAPQIPIGRINATNADQVSAYLSKIKEMEALPFNELFRKHTLQLSGGKTDGEITNFSRNILDFQRTLESDFLGGKAFNTGKKTKDAVEFINVSDRVNKGVGYINFFGHSSGNSTDIEIGRVSKSKYGFRNKGKYPIILVNGCQAGEIFGDFFTFGEDWMLTPNVGAVGFIANSSSALSSSLKRWSDLYIGLGFGKSDFVGKSIGEVIIEVSKAYYEKYGKSKVSRAQVEQVFLQGDPAYPLFGGNNPDYFTKNEFVSAKGFKTKEILANQDSFLIDVIVRNFGKSVKDSLEVKVTRTLANGDKQEYRQKFRRVLYQDTLHVVIKNDAKLNNSGVNTFDIQLNPDEKIKEITNANNSASIKVSIFSGSTLNLYPAKYMVLPNKKVNFQWQSSNLLKTNNHYELEVDTDAEFKSPNKRSFKIDGRIFVKKEVDFSSFNLPDTATIYWRTRFEKSESEKWVESSFTIIKNSEIGWGQFSKQQLSENKFRGIFYDNNLSKWTFNELKTPLEFFTWGADNKSLKYEVNQIDYKAIVNGLNLFITSSVRDILCKFRTDGIGAVAFDRDTGAPFSPLIKQNTDDVFNDEICGRLPQQIYNFKESSILAAKSRFELLIDKLKKNDQIVIFNLGALTYSKWTNELYTSLEKIGVTKSMLSGMTDKQPIIILGKKGAASGSATIIKNNGTATSVTEQAITLKQELVSKLSNGEIASQRIGPAKKWKKLEYLVSKESSDASSVKVYGIDKNGNKKDFSSGSRTLESINVANIDAKKYPYLEVLNTFSDLEDRTPTQLKYWKVDYDFPPDGITQVAKAEVLKLDEGEEIKKRFHFINISNENFTDSLDVSAILSNQKTGNTLKKAFKIAPPKKGDSTSFDVAFSSLGITGENTLNISVVPNETEQFLVNNNITLINSIVVESDGASPTLDVTFDGYHILNGDIVSPDPLISIRMKDDNSFLYKKDTIGVSVELKPPGEDTKFQQINFSDSRLKFTPATEKQDLSVDFQPGKLKNGVHSLRVQAQDKSGNKAGEKPYEIDFEVINESSITHFYPYPNPFSTSCRFVFTLTGSTVPSEIKIQIMTVTGTIVREITQDEIGAIRVGNNITQYAWDGRDEYGSQLANGVYFYRVLMGKGSENMKKRATQADKAFKNDFGKLYILR